MGDVLSKPITDKHSFRAEGADLKVGGSEMQGWRRGMEDAHTAILALEPGGPGDYAFFGVFDGHCGKGTANYCGEHLHKKLLLSDAWRADPKDFQKAFEQAYLSLDDDLANDPLFRHDGSGSTAVTCLIGGPINGPKKIVCANAGDSRCVLCRHGKAEPLSYDHKPTCESEKARILAAGGFVASGRVNGNLALSRAIGDFEFKQNKNLPPEDQAISAKPDVVIRDLTPDDEFIVLACDGVWDVMSNDEVVQFVRDQLQDTEDLAHICELVFEKCIAPSAPGLGCDNMTMMIIMLKDAKECKKRAEKRRAATATSEATGTTF